MRRSLSIVALLVAALAFSPALARASTGPVAAYGFEESSGATAVDSSGNGNNGTITGATRVQGRFGTALSFGGSGDIVKVPDAPSLDLTTGMTLEAWVKPIGTSGYHTVILKERPGDLSYALYGSSPGAPSAQLTTSPSAYKIANGTEALPINLWSHIAATFDGTTLKLFVNGSQVSSVAWEGSLFTSNGTLDIGGNSIWTEWFQGLIDEVRIYDRPLTAAEIQTDMAAPVVTGTPAGPPDDQLDPSKSGSWTAPEDWPLVAVHASMLSNGKVAMWDAFGAALGSERIWDPMTDSFQSTPSGWNLFCAGHVLLPDGRLFTAGGHVLAYVGLQNTELLNPLTGKWTDGPMMSRGRWYPTATTLPDGRVLIVSGDGIPTTPGNYDAFYYPSNTVPEVYNPATNKITALPQAALKMPLYPFMFVAPDGRVVEAGPDTTTRLLDVDTGTWSTLASKSPIDGHSAVMYRPGKILKTGTWGDPDFPSSVPITNRAAVLDLNQTVPSWQEVAPMNFHRVYQTLTVMPDGNVLAMGGTTSAHGDDVTNTAVLAPEIWNPDTNTWTVMASATRPRGYHNISLLLPDGRILLAGSGRLDGSMMPNEQTAEIYSPPYLHKGPRPMITGAPPALRYGAPFEIDTPDVDSIAKVTLVRTGAVTHGFNMDQRYQELSFHKDNGHLIVEAPTRANIAPPGYYYVFIVNGNGVPSVAQLLPLQITDDAVAPTKPAGLTATGALGKVSLSWTASTDNVGVTNYDIYRSTTQGFTPGSANKVTSVAGTTWVDTGVTAGTAYYYRVIARDAAGNTSTPSDEASAAALADTTAPTVSVTAPASGATVNGSVTVAASAGDDVGVAGVQFKLDGADLGGEDTSAPYSVTWDTTAGSGGPHTLTAIARDAAGNRTTAQTVSVTVDNSAPAGPQPVAAYAFEETSGTTVSDATGHGHTGTLSSGVTRTTTGKTGGALKFNGTSGMVTIPDADDLDLTTGMTLEAWVNPTANTGWRLAVMKEFGSDLAYALYSGGSTQPLATITTAGATGYGEAHGPAGSQPALNAWTHLAGTYDGTTLKLYANGTLISSAAVPGGAINVGSGVLRLGGNGIWGEWFAGQLDDVRVYNTALTAAQIQSDMSTPVGGAAPPDTAAPSQPAGLTATGAIGKVSLSWTASTDNVGVTGYDVYRSATQGFTPDASSKVASVTGTSWTDTGRAPGTYYYRVIARDAAGNASTPSAEASGTALADTTAPTVSVTAPAAGATVSGSVSVTASASDDVGVTGVQFKLDGANLGAEDTTAPYSVTWDTTTATAGTHTLSAVAKDAAGNPGTAANVSVTVDNSAPPPPKPVAAYAFSETSGTSVADATGNGHTGTASSGVTHTTTGKTGGALKFNGTNAMVTIPDATDLDLTTGMTLEAWVNPTANTGWRTALMKEFGSDLGYALYAGGATQPLATITRAGISGYGEAHGPSGSQPALNTWTHLAATYDGTTLKLYKNGALISSATVPGSINVGTGALRIGGNGVWGEWFAGQLDDVRVYNTPLTAAQITADMNTPVG